jgi:hypothetical protein
MEQHCSTQWPQARRRRGSSLIEVLMALVVLAATAAWSLGAVVAAERALGASDAHRAALHRAERALTDLEMVPCDSLVTTPPLREPRWHLIATRTRAGDVVHDAVRVQPLTGDTVAVSRAVWCR